MKTYINPYNFRVALFGTRRINRDRWIYRDRMPGAEIYEKQPVTYAEAAGLCRLTRQVLLEHGYWPAWVFFTLIVTVVFNLAAAISYLLTR